MPLTLTDYQEVAKQFLLQNPRAAVFMGCGLGKTATTLSTIEELMLDGACCGALVVAPLRVSTLTWPNEVKQWFPWMRVADLRTKEGMETLKRGGAHIYTINYESLPKFAREYLYNRKGAYAFDTIIFDELTKAKNARSMRIRALRPYLPKITRRIGLTGTPTPNSLLELWPQISLLDDGEALGKSQTLFRDTYFQSDYMGYKWTLKLGADAQIYSRLAKVALVLRSSDYLDIPDTEYEDIDVALPPEARETYKTMEQDLLVLLATHPVEIVAVNAAVLVNKLLQIAGGALYDEERGVHVLHKAKIDALVKLVNKLGEPVLIACNYKHERERILKAVTGAVEWRDDILPAWDAGRVRAIVADPRSIGHGLNLQAGGRIVIWFSRTWSRENYDQMNCRVARKGQGKVPQVFHITCPDTADEAVAEALRQKGDGQAALLSALRSIQEMQK
jgi:SNF2 family DNA or RNA helicase